MVSSIADQCVQRNEDTLNTTTDNGLQQISFPFMNRNDMVRRALLHSAAGGGYSGPLRRAEGHKSCLAMQWKSEGRGP